MYQEYYSVGWRAFHAAYVVGNNNKCLLSYHKSYLGVSIHLIIIQSSNVVVNTGKLITQDCPMNFLLFLGHGLEIVYFCIF